MPAYVIADVDVTNQQGYDDYRSRTLATAEKFGGRFIARGGATEVKEGTWQPHRLIMLQFADLDTARRWYDSPEYQAIIKYRTDASNTNLVLVEGLPA
jgi:uncharacterized protein (DUF1330 family)